MNIKLKNILPRHHVDICVRTYDPDGNDMLFGYCHWTGKELISDDGDTYSVEEDVAKFEFSADKRKLTYWFEPNWLSNWWEG